jgi:hypothetical protein
MEDVAKKKIGRTLFRLFKFVFPPNFYCLILKLVHYGNGNRNPILKEAHLIVKDDHTCNNIFKYIKPHAINGVFYYNQCRGYFFVSVIRMKRNFLFICVL